MALIETAVLMLPLAQQLIPNGPAAGRGSIAVYRGRQIRDIEFWCGRIPSRILAPCGNPREK